MSRNSKTSYGPITQSFYGFAYVALILLVLLSAPCYAASSCPPAPRYSDTRYDDDLSYLRDPGCRTDFWDSVKYMSLYAEKGWYLSLGGEIRERYERFHNRLWGQQPQSPDWQLDSHTHFRVNYLHFFAGGYLENTAPIGKDVNFVTTSIQ